MKKTLNNIITLIIFLTSSLSGLAVSNKECMECHDNKNTVRVKSEGMADDLYLDYSRFRKSVHNINEVSCVDCHEDIEELKPDSKVPHPTNLARVACEDCHDEEGEAYKNSVHWQAKNKGITIPCQACHGYHYVTYLEANSVYERENGFCLKCHDPKKFHDWLPQKGTHFAHIECAVCHVDPETPRYVNLRYHDYVADKYFSGAEMLAVLGIEKGQFMELIDQNKDKIIDTAEFEKMIAIMRSKGSIGTFHGELLVDLVPDVHKIQRGGASRDCNRCHNPESVFFDNVYITLISEDGSADRYKLSRKVLSSYYVNHFYAIGSTRVRSLDKIGAGILVSGLIGISFHLFLRLFTAKFRRKIKFEREAEQK